MLFVFIGLIFIYWLLPDGDKNKDYKELEKKLLDDLNKKYHNKF